MLVPLGLPDWALRFIIVLVIVGFFVALAVAWGFGAGKGPHADFAPPCETPMPVERSRSPSPTPLAPASDPSVAVLAFADMSPGRDQGYFCEGAAEEIINALAGVRGLRVASRSGSFQFKDRAVDNREVARLLSVRAVLDGSVRKAGERVRVAAPARRRRRRAALVGDIRPAAPGHLRDPGRDRASDGARVASHAARR